MRPQSLIFPWLLILFGIVAALDCAVDGDFMLAAIWCLVGAVGWNELRTTNDFNQGE